MEQKKIPVIVCIDVEPDGPVHGPARLPEWSGYEEARRFFNGMCPGFSSSTGSPAHVSWFYRMDPQIANVYGSGTRPVTAYPDYVADFENKGDVFGLHTHLYRFDAERDVC